MISLWYQNWDMHMKSHQLDWAGIIFQVTTDAHCCYWLKFSSLPPPPPCVCQHYWQCRSLEPAEFLPADFHPNSYYCSVPESTTAVLLGLQRPMLLFLSSTKTESVNWLGGSHVKSGSQELARIYTLPAPLTRSHTPVPRLIWQQMVSKRTVKDSQISLLISLFWRNFLLCSLTYSRGYWYLILAGGGTGGVKSRPLPCSSIFLVNMQQLKWWDI